MNPIDTAPENRLIVVRFFEDADRVVGWWDLTHTKDCPYSDEELSSCWRDRYGETFEVYDAIGWRECGAIDLLSPRPRILA